MLYAATDSLLVVCRDDSPGRALPGSVRLRSLKGPAQPELRQPHHMRSWLDGPNRMMTYIHAADEPIDIIREFGILFDGDDRRELYAQLTNTSDEASTIALNKTVQEMYDEYPEHSLDIATATARVRALLRERARKGGTAGGAARRANALLDRAALGASLPWREFAAELRRSDATPNVWDLLTLGTQFVRHDREGVVCIIDDDGLPEWLRGEGLLVGCEMSRRRAIGAIPEHEITGAIDRGVG